MSVGVFPVFATKLSHDKPEHGRFFSVYLAEDVETRLAKLERVAEAARVLRDIDDGTTSATVSKKIAAWEDLERSIAALED